ncbi:flagellar biosynthesis regulator FlaF [Meridianimarinicoccus sp. MJW13]|uniref:flagellar biosynthesis regulator FlaF n=2 Tax=unclassified Meridianimarinicoccus TaxID=2923344 RepID=UPI00299F8F43|nr:flagellar biosynthesis regulator FlaF [Fluviibacterium sp. MJW13]
MNALNMARTAYNPVTTPLRTPRSTEYEAFARVTRKLRMARDGNDTTLPMLAGALHENRRMWNFFAASVADAANELPNHLRAQIFYLAEYTTEHSRRVLKGQADIDALIDINTAMMRGLRQDEGTT